MAPNPAECAAWDDAQDDGALLYLHLALVTAGFIPGFGEVFDATDVIISLAKTATSGERPVRGLDGPVRRLGRRRRQNIEAARRLQRSLQELPQLHPDTLVLLADGTTKPIKDITVGDTVLATDPETGHTAPKKVTHTWARHRNCRPRRCAATVVI